MWTIEPTSQWEKDKKWYEKKRPNELAAVLHNLKRYLQQLNCSPNAKSVMAGYIHPEPQGVVALDQKGSRGSLQETRLYLLPIEDQKLLYIITIGNKADQHDDIQYCKDFANSLTKKD